MGYLENLRDERLEEFNKELLKKKEKAPEEYLFQEDFSIVSFSYGLKEGWKMIHELNRLIAAIKQRKKQLEIIIDKIYSTLKNKIGADSSLSQEKKKELLKDIKNLSKDSTKEETDRIKKLKKMKRDILLRVGNIFLYVLSALLSIGFGSLLYLNNIVVNAIVYPISAIAILCFIAIQILYTIKYLKAIKSTIHGIIDFSIKRTFSTLLMVWWYVAILSFVNNWNTDIITYSFSAIFILNIIFVIYDLFLSSTFFDIYESTLSLVAAIIIGFVMFADSFNHHIVSQIGSIFQLFACILLSMLIVKKFLIDKQSIKTMWSMMYLVFISLLTILLTIFALYKLFWVTPAEGQVADNTLFSAVMGIYAAILGGALTLAGVATTIKYNENLRKNEERKKSQPLFSYVCKQLDHIKKIVITCSEFENLNGIIDSNQDSQDWLFIEPFAMENSDKIEFFVCGLFINGSLYKIQTKILVKKDYAVCFNFNESHFALKTINEMKLYVEDLIGNLYTMQLNFSFDNSTITINGNKPIQFTGEINE